MSLINKMLQDLDSRRAPAGDFSALPKEVRPLRSVRKAAKPYLWFVAGAAIAASAALLWHLASSVPEAAASLPPSGGTIPLATASVVQASAVPQPIAAAVVAPGPAAGAAGVIVAEPAAIAPQGGEGLLKPPPGLPADRTAERQVEEQPKPAPRAASFEAAPRSEHAAVARAMEKPQPAEREAGIRIEKQLRLATPEERAENHYRRAVALLNQGRIADAINGLRTALKEDPSHPAALPTLLGIVVEQKRFDDVLVILQELRSVHPAHVALAIGQARIQLEKGDLAAAAATLQSVEQAGANHAEYQGFAAALLQRLGRQREAIAHYQTALRLAPQSGIWWTGLGISLEADGRGGEAREAFQRAKASGVLTSELERFVEQRLRTLP